MAKTTIQTLLKKKAEGKKITALTAYDYPTATMVDEAGVDVILIGDSLGVVVQGLDNTLPVSMKDMLYHTRIVARAVKNAMVIGDMPFLSYQTGVGSAVRNAGRFLQAGAQAVKIEGGGNVLPVIRELTKFDIPVMAHIGITPQSIHRYGGYRVQGRDEAAALKLVDEAKQVEEAGAFSLVLEGIPTDLGRRITESIAIPTVGIGAGKYCDGQILVIQDLLGLFDRFVPKFVKRYANLKQESLSAIQAYIREVEEGAFPGEDQSYS